MGQVGHKHRNPTYQEDNLFDWLVDDCFITVVIVDEHGQPLMDLMGWCEVVVPFRNDDTVTKYDFHHHND